MKPVIILVFLLSICDISVAQSSKRMLTTFASGIAYNNQPGLGKGRSIGFATTTGTELYLRKHLYLFAGLDFQSFSNV
jgi:hypothetical protein